MFAYHDRKIIRLMPYKNVVTGETTIAYWSRVVDGKIVDFPMLRGHDGRWLNPETWINISNDGDAE